MTGTQISAAGIKALFAKASNALPLSAAIVIVTVVNGVLSPAAKARIVFLRWKHALPGHTAFSKLAVEDPRIDMTRLAAACGGTLPADPDQQNQVWYRLYKAIQSRPTVDHVQRDFLLTRDYASFLALAFVVFGVAAFVELSPVKAAAFYALAMIFQFFVVRQAAANYGRRFVTTVLAEAAVEVTAPSTRRPRKKAAAG